MDVTPDTVRQVLRSWLATEVLTPQDAKDGWSGLAAEKQGQQRNKGIAAANDPAQWEVPLDDDATPWPVLSERLGLEGDQDALVLDKLHADPERVGPHPRPWYSVILGALPTRQAFKRLDAAFSDEADEDETNRHTQGYVIAATVVLDEWGVLVPDTLALASFAWGLGHMLAGGSSNELATWDGHERDLKARLSNRLSPMDPGGQLRSLTWRELRAASCILRDELRLPADLWLVAPCTIRVVGKHPPTPDILSSFLLPDLAQVLRKADHLPDAASSYLGLRPPARTWDALASSNRPQLSSLLQPGLFPLGRWPGPGLHPLTLLQQAAVNAIVRDLDRGGLASVNGPPGTGKTTLLRDLVAHVLVSRAERLAEVEHPGSGLSTLDLMDFAIVVASKNNAAVENVSLELPVRAKALDRSVWQDGGLDYFGHTANAVLGVSPDAKEDERAWGLMAARLGKAENRRMFFQKFWWDADWGLRDWLDRVAWPDTPQNRSTPPGKLARLDPPPRCPEARDNWRKAREEFRQALERCRRLKTGLQALSDAGSRLAQIEAQLPAAESRLDIAERDLASASRAVKAARVDHGAHCREEATEAAKLAALSSVKPSKVSKLFRTRAWRAHEAGVREQVAKLDVAQDVTRAAQARLTAAVDEEERRSDGRHLALMARDALRRDAVQQACRVAEAEMADAVPGPGFWDQPDADLQRAAPWNGGAFRTARDELFTAAVRLHRAFIVAAARRIKPSLNTIARAAQGAPDAPRPSATDWGVFFLVVPVVSTTFASVGRMFRGFGAAEIGWLLIDEAGQAAPQDAVGAIWRARRAVVIGDPLQIEPVVTTPRRTTRLIFEANNVDPEPWAAPDQSAQTLADRASQIQGRFRVVNGEAGREERVTGIPLLVHRRCEQPMFGIANHIAYDDRMVFATAEGASPIRGLLGASAWIDVDAPSTDKWVAAEGRLIAATVARLCDGLREPPDLYVICPFKMPARRLKALLLATPSVLPQLAAAHRKRWIEHRVGTVHTFQGKEAEAVILMLGAGRGAKNGSRIWAGRTPNLLNVAATRAKRVLYVVGNRVEWQGVGVFATAALALPVRSGQEWSFSDQVGTYDDDRHSTAA